MPDELLGKFEFCKPLQYSAKKNRGRGALDEALKEAVEWVRKKGGHAKIGVGRLKVRRKLEALRDEDTRRPSGEREHRIIDMAEFEQICKEQKGVSNPAHLLAYLHECGVVFHQPETLGNKIILDQE